MARAFIQSDAKRRHYDRNTHNNPPSRLISSDNWCVRATGLAPWGVVLYSGPANPRDRGKSGRTEDQVEPTIRRYAARAAATKEVIRQLNNARKTQ